MKLSLQQWKFYVVVCLLIAGSYVVTRLVNLTLLPIFTDEAIYLRWSQIGGNDAAWRFISLTDGKQPLYTWFAMIFLRLFSDPLVAGRMVSVVAGFATLVGLVFLSNKLFKSTRITIITCFLYIISPFTVMYDRLALYDSLSTALSVWSCYLAIRLVKEVKLDVSLLLGLTLGFGMINKTSGFLSLYLIPATLLLFDWKSVGLKSRLVKWVFYVGIAAVLSQMVYGILRLSPYFHMIAQKDSVFVHPISNLFFTWRFFEGNAKGLIDWFINYLTLPIVLSMIPALFLKKNEWREKFLLFIWCVSPMVALAYFGKILYPRYILFMVVPLLMFSAMTLEFILTKWKLQLRTLVLISVIVIPSFRGTYYILFQPVYAPIPYADRGQLFDDWPSGYGIKEMNITIGKELEKGPVAVFTDGTFGLLPYAVEIYHGTNPNLFVKGVWPFPASPSAEMIEQVNSKPTYLLMNASGINEEHWNVTLIEKYQKGLNPGVTARLYKLLPRDTNTE